MADIVLYRMGDFYEALGGQAVTVGEVLQIAVTTRPMQLAGIPRHSLHRSAAQLAAAGHSVRVAEPEGYGGESEERGGAAETVLRSILSLLGNVNHDTPSGPNGAQLRGGMLESIREMALAGLPDPTAEAPGPVHAVLFGSPLDGFKAHGPFPTEAAASAWGEFLGEGGEWVMEIHPITDDSCMRLYTWSEKTEVGGQS